jgi:hypothetical protein
MFTKCLNFNVFEEFNYVLIRIAEVVNLELEICYNGRKKLRNDPFVLKIGDFKDSLEVDEVFKRTVISSGDGSRFNNNFLNNIHNISEVIKRYDHSMNSKVYKTDRNDVRKTMINQTFVKSDDAGFRILKCNQDNLLIQCKGTIKFQELKLNDELNYFHNGKLCKDGFIFEKGDQVIRYSCRCLGGRGDFDSISEEDESEYEYEYEEIDEEEPSELNIDEEKPGFFKDLWKICVQNQYKCDPRRLIKEDVDPVFDDFVTKAKEMIPKTRFMTNKRIYEMHNLYMFRRNKDMYGNQEKYKKFAHMLRKLSLICEEEGIE